MAANQEDSMRKGPWEEDEDELLKAVILKMGEGRWDALAQSSGLLRSGKSCRLRWLNYLRPNLKHGKISADEEAVIIQLQQQWGNKWSKIAKMLPGRTDNELKNFWRTRARKQQSQIRKLEMCANRSVMSSEQESSNAGTSVESLSVTCGNQESSTEKVPDKIYGDAFSLDFGVAHSPYETRLSHWMSEFSEDQFDDPMPHQATLDSGQHEYSWDMSQDCFFSLWDS